MNPYEYKTFNLSVLRHSTWNDTGDDDDDDDADDDEDQEDDDDDDDDDEYDDDDDDGGGGDDDDDCNKYGSTSGLDETCSIRKLFLMQSPKFVPGAGLQGGPAGKDSSCCLRPHRFGMAWQEQ